MLESRDKGKNNAWQRDRYIYSGSAAQLCTYSRDKSKISGRARSKSTSLCFGGDLIFAPVLTLEIEASRFLRKYHSHANETAIYVVSGACLFRIT